MKDTSDETWVNTGTPCDGVPCMTDPPDGVGPQIQSQPDPPAHCIEGDEWEALDQARTTRL